MNGTSHIWMRSETRDREQRAPLVPKDAARLIEAGFSVSVENSPNRAIEAAEYRAAGCEIVTEGSWRRAPQDAWILGLKELPRDTGPLRHRHVYFAHAFKGQPGADHLLGRFLRGSGRLYDLEYLADEVGRRVAAFGYWAGYVGAALGVLARSRQLDALRPTDLATMQADLRASSADVAGTRALVIGAAGRCGRGAVDALAEAGIEATRWDMAETRRIDRRALMAHDLMINAVGISGQAQPFLRCTDIRTAERKLSLIVDVTCDLGSASNALPIYDRLTTWDMPVTRLQGTGPCSLDMIAIDNLPSVLPLESSADFSAQLTPHLLAVGQSVAWWTAGACFERLIADMELARTEELARA